MQVIISKTLINAAAEQASQMDQLMKLLMQVGCDLSEKGDTKDRGPIWDEIVLDVARGKCSTKGGTITIQDDNLVIDIADEMMLDCMEAYSGLLNALLPAALGFCATLKVVFKAYENKLAAIGRKYFK